MNIPAMGSGQSNRRPAFTLLELLISIAIIGILTAIVFTNLSSTKDLAALKSASRQLQVDLQGAQIKAQGGLLVNSNATHGYGIQLSEGTNNYTIFADALSSSNSVYDSGTDYLVKTTAMPGITIVKLRSNASGLSPANIFFTAPNGTGVLTFANDTPVGSATIGTITLKSTKLKICYAIQVIANVGTVTETRNVSCT